MHEVGFMCAQRCLGLQEQQPGCGSDQQKQQACKREPREALHALCASEDFQQQLSEPAAVHGNDGTQRSDQLRCTASAVSSCATDWQDNKKTSVLHVKKVLRCLMRGEAVTPGPKK